MEESKGLNGTDEENIAMVKNRISALSK